MDQESKQSQKKSHLKGEGDWFQRGYNGQKFTKEELIELNQSTLPGYQYEQNESSGFVNLRKPRDKSETKTDKWQPLPSYAESRPTEPQELITEGDPIPEKIRKNEEALSREEQSSQREELIAAELAQEQAEDWELGQIQDGINTIYEEGQGTDFYPFVLNYIIFLFPLAFLNDAVDLLDLIPVVGWILSWFASVILSLILIFTKIFFNDSYVKAQKYLNSLEDRLKTIEQKLLLATRVTRYSLATAKALRRISATKGIAKAIPRTLVKLRKPIKPLLRNPTVKIVIGAGLEAFPILSWVPWSTLSVTLAYFDERKIHKEAKKAAENIKKAYDEALINEI